MEYLTRKYCTTDDLKREIKLLDPAVVSSFPYCENDKEDLDDMFGPLALDKATKLVFLPMNDNTNPD